MTVETWKEEFYPVEAEDQIGSDKLAVEHSLLKWKGLERDALDRHRLFPSGSDWAPMYLILSDGARSFTVGDHTCALCQRHPCCSSCPIVQHTERDCSAEFDAWLGAGDPRPMTQLLEKIAAHLSNA